MHYLGVERSESTSQSSTPRAVASLHRLSRRGNHKLNNAIHIAALTQIRNPSTDGRIYFERKVAEGKTKREALRSLKLQVPNAPGSRRNWGLDSKRIRTVTPARRSGAVRLFALNA